MSKVAYLPVGKRGKMLEMIRNAPAGSKVVVLIDHPKDPFEVIVDDTVEARDMALYAQVIGDAVPSFVEDEKNGE